MVYDPANEKDRKPRQFRNTPARKYIQIASLSLTLCYALMMYISFRKHILPHINDERYKINEDKFTMAYDYAVNPLFRGAIEKAIERQEAKAKTEAELKTTQTDKQI